MLGKPGPFLAGDPDFSRPVSRLVRENSVTEGIVAIPGRLKVRPGSQTATHSAARVKVGQQFAAYGHAHAVDDDDQHRAFAGQESDDLLQDPLHRDQIVGLGTGSRPISQQPCEAVGLGLADLRYHLEQPRIGLGEPSFRIA